MNDSPKIALGYDGESVAYLDLLTSDYVSRWSEGQGSVTLTSLTAFGGRTLFGDCPTVVLKLEDKESVKATLAYLQAKTPEELNERFPSGIFIRTQVPIMSLKKLQEHIMSLGGDVMSKNKKDRQELPEELLKRTNLSSDVKKFLLEFSQGEPEHVVGVVRQVSTLGPKQQAALSVEAIVVRLPQDPQTAPPWDIEGPFWRGDTKETLKTARRICGNDGPLLLLWQLRKTSQMVLDFAGMGGTGGLDRAALAKITCSQPNYGLTVAERTAKKVGLATAIRVAEIIADYGNKIKGGSKLDAEILMDAALIKATTIIKGR